MARWVRWVLVVVLAITVAPSTRTANADWLAGQVARFAGPAVYRDGIGMSARFWYPQAVAINKAQTFALVGDGSAIVRRIDLATSATTTIVGTSGVYTSTDGLGLASSFMSTVDLDISADSTYALVVDSSNNGALIRRIDLATNQVTTLAGNKFSANSSVDGTGTSATFNTPNAIALSNSGGFAIIGDFTSIRKLDLATNAVTTLAGHPTNGGDTTVAGDGNGSAARINGVTGLGIASDDSFVVFSDFFRCTVRKMSLVAPYAVTTVAGVASMCGNVDGATGATSRIGQLRKVTLSSDNAFIYFADGYNGALRRTNVTTGQTERVAGSTDGSSGTADGSGGAAGTSRFDDPYDIAVSNDRTFALVAGAAEGRIRRIDLTNVTGAGAVTSPYGSVFSLTGSTNGTGDAVRFNYPGGITVNGAGTAGYIADTNNQLIRKITVATGEVTAIAGISGNSGLTDNPGSTARFFSPLALAVDANDSFLIVADTSNNAIRRISLTAPFAVQTIAGNGAAGSANGSGAVARFNGPTGVAISPDSSFVLVSDTGNNAIRKVLLTAPYTVSTIAGDVTTDGSTDGVGTAARFYSPNGIAIARSGAFALVAESGNRTVRRIDLATNAVTTVAGLAGTPYSSVDGVGGAARFAYPYGITLAANDTLALIADYQTVRRLVVETGAVRTLAGQFGNSGSHDGTGNDVWMSSAIGIGSSNDGSVTLIVDQNMNLVRRLAANPVPTLTSVAPSQVAAVAGALLTLTGSNFAPGSVARIEGTALTTTYVSPTQLTAVTPAGLVAGSTVNVTVSNEAPGGGVSNAVPVLVVAPAEAPAISGLSPAAIQAGSPAFALTVLGSNISSGAVVRWNGQALTTAFTNASTLVAQVPAPLVATAGTAQVTIVNVDGQSSNARAFAVTAGPPSWVIVVPAAMVQSVP